MAKTDRDGDDLDAFIAKRVAKNPDFTRLMVDAASRREAKRRGKASG